MRYLLDTDHLSILQRQTGEDYNNLARRMVQHPLSDFAISIVTFHEQMLGSHACINRARTSNEVVKGYEIMARIVSDFKVLPIAWAPRKIQILLRMATRKRGFQAPKILNKAINRGARFI
jgi:predicted nucleic acid-binding protein